ncbi:ABC-type hemin transport system, ATPase component [Sinorhizobium sojae CCBAU 05684]|uniref:ABC-type hemin transport system, ATPase component n=1 Tax=Sinorhizobium sojae CCBAU 05684 TaxID=716928 RepID=A0A249PDZ3_9HYPH|nr:ABC-type hemin transport system, ATPase component [Sinorhizobium sojae CCBAU 05684]
MPRDVLTEENMETVFGCRMQVSVAPARDVPFVLPQLAAY